MRLLQGASEDWEVIPEPIGKWCNIQNDDDIYQVNVPHLSTTQHPSVSYLSVDLLPTCLSAGVEFLSEEWRKPAADVV